MYIHRRPFFFYLSFLALKVVTERRRPSDSETFAIHRFYNFRKTNAKHADIFFM